MRRCLDAGMTVDPTPGNLTPDRNLLYPLCNTVNRNKRTLKCAACDRAHHLTCVGITQAQAAQLPVWHCDACLHAVNQRDAVHDATDETDEPPTDMAEALADLKARTRLLQHIPRRHRHKLASDLASSISSALEQRTPSAWWRFFSFIYRSPLAIPADRLPPREGVDQPNPREAATTTEDALARRVARKCADGDIRAALRLLTTSDSVVSPSEEVATTLQTKHPPAAPDEAFPAPPDLGQHRLAVEEADVLAAIKSAPPGSAAGLDGVRPLHLSQLVAGYTAEAGRRLLSSLTELCNVALAGDIPDDARQAFFSANLIAIKKKDGGLRPIAIGSAYRRLASKVLARRMSSALASELEPIQLGVGVRSGSEAAVHAVREHIDAHLGTPNYVLAKLDLTNAFNTVHRSAVLREVIHRFPAAAPMVSQAYSQPSPLHLGSSRLWSSRGVQQGDPLGPILFALAVDPVLRSLSSPLNLWFLDDGTLAGPKEAVAADLHRLFPALRELGLEVNPRKCEITYLDGQGTGADVGQPSPAVDNIPSNRNDGTSPTDDGASTSTDAHTSSHTDTFFRVACPTPLTSLFILGAPIHTQGNTTALAKIEDITKTLINRTTKIGSHAALFFLARYAAVPRATYLLRAAPVHTSMESLRIVDEMMRQAISHCCNVELDDNAWAQASLPLRTGGLGVRRLADVALPAYIASVEATRDLVCTINRRPNGDRSTRQASAIDVFTANQCPDLNPELDLTQRNLDDAASKHRLDELLASANQIDRARLLAAAAPHSGAWLSAVPVEVLGLLLPDEAVRVNVALRLGTRVQQPHRCRCGAMSDALGHHSLSCHRNPGRLPRHTALNDTIYRALAAAGITAILEPRGLDRGDGRRPDGITVFPFRRGRMLMWDATCVNTFSATHTILRRWSGRKGR